MVEANPNSYYFFLFLCVTTERSKASASATFHCIVEGWHGDRGGNAREQDYRAECLKIEDMNRGGKQGVGVREAEADMCWRELEFEPAGS